MRYSEDLAIQGSQIWPQCDITRRQRPMRALTSLTLQRKLRTNMRRTQLLGYSPQPGCSGRPACCISSRSTFRVTMTFASNIEVQFQKLTKRLHKNHLCNPRHSCYTAFMLFYCLPCMILSSALKSYTLLQIIQFSLQVL